MNRSVDVWIDVTEAAGLGEPLRTRATVTYPGDGRIGPRAGVCYAFPGGGYGRGYFTFDMPGSDDGGQAGWFASRGWIFVGCEHLFAGESDSPAVSPERVTLEVLAAVNAATVEAVSAMLSKGTLTPEIEPIDDDAVRIGFGHSLGGSLLVVQQGQHRSFDAIAVLGTSARHVVPAQEPGTAVLKQPYTPRGSMLSVGSGAVTEEITAFRERPDGLPLPTWVFHYDDVPRDILERDMRNWPARQGEMPSWASATMPPLAMTLVTPGIIALEAHLVDVPIFIGYGERDLSPRPELEPLFYENSPDITLFRCPRMGHMHNFASTRYAMWTRLLGWSESVSVGRSGA